eukprot:2516884-Pleurochrysis_carterae.AAC.1
MWPRVPGRKPVRTRACARASVCAQASARAGTRAGTQAGRPRFPRTLVARGRGAEGGECCRDFGRIPRCAESGQLRNLLARRVGKS